MLEIKNLTKIYKSKGGVEVKALDNVSLKFPETGMVFLLGKSGSGKSTLLNVCGGLDNPTSGEIIVKGRSSIDFKQSDFDSYRNTFVGFIFQEYNILDEFTVEENIALALELQGREKDKSAINNLLEMVDLKGYNDRKPNTLSGGQKQRLAIARALIKSPEIIMADEPTGALDSATGKQVFDTLKKLSEDTLIMVVSHDRDFAEKYGDRIIELKDGSIISDVTKSSDGFKDTKEEDIKIKEYDKKDSEFISSKFPLKHAIKMGLSSLKTKKFRLVMTIFLCTVAFTMFGLLSTVIFFDDESVFKDTLKNSNLSLIQLYKEYEVNMTTYQDGEVNFEINYTNPGHITESELDKLKKEYGNDTFGAIDVIYSYSVHDTSINYWLNKIMTLAYLSEDNSYRKNIVGQYPKENNEIAISSYTANVIINSKMDDVDTGKTLNVTEIKDLIGKKIKLQDTEYTITGIVDSGEISKEFDVLKNAGKVDESILSDFVKELEDGLYLVAFLTKDALEVASKEYEMIEDMFTHRQVLVSEEKNNSYDFTNYQYGSYASYSMAKDRYEIIKFKEFNSLNDNEVIVDYGLFANLVSNHYSNYTGDYEKVRGIIELSDSVRNGGVHISEDGENYVFVKYSDSELKEKAKELYDLVKNVKINYNVAFKLLEQYDQTAYGETFEFSVVGIMFGENMNSYEYRLIVSDNIYKKALDKEINHTITHIIETDYVDKGFYDIVYVGFDKTQEQINDFYSIRSNEKFDSNQSKISLTGATISMLDTVSSLVEEFSQMFFWIGTVLAIFAALLFSNFISVSISYKRREIGILRAIGAKGSDVFKIFFSESFVLSIICVVLSCIGTIVISGVLNNALDVGVSIFVFGIVSLLFIILIAVLTAFIATFLPVNKAARKKPIDSIRSV